MLRMANHPQNEEAARYPIGKFQYVAAKSQKEFDERIGSLAALSERLRDMVAGMCDEQLDTPYREGGWTVRQVVHHIPDSHMNSYVRFKWALTEDAPTIKTYEEDRWAELPDSRLAVENSLVLLDALHRRWVALMRTMTPQQWQRTFVHPQMGPVTLEKALALYAWHGEHHLAHVERVREATKKSAAR